MSRLSTRALVLVAGLLTGAAAPHAVPPAAGQAGPGWVALFDGKTIGGEWDRVGETNWRVEEGAIVADKRTGEGAAYLVTKAKYKDFQVYAEFWASDDANSGIFLRCQEPAKIGDRSCYEVNIFDQRKDPTYGTGGIVHFVEVSPMLKAGGKWNTYEITAKGRQVIVILNGTKTAELHNGLFADGVLALQHGDGVIKFRKVLIRPL